jgi:hypothetical protein
VTNDNVVVHTRRCVVCGEGGGVTIPREAYDRWKAGEFIQKAWPDGPVEEREMLISGTHGGCFDRLFPSDGDECMCATPCHEADVGVGVISCMPQHCPVHGGDE